MWGLAGVVTELVRAWLVPVTEPEPVQSGWLKGKGSGGRYERHVMRLRHGVDLLGWLIVRWIVWIAGRWSRVVADWRVPLAWKGGT